MTRPLCRRLRIAGAWLLGLVVIAAARGEVIIDAEGREVHLRVPPQRIIALAPHIVENLYAIGAGDLLVGAVDYSDYPSAAASLPRVGGIGGISVEAIAALNPDLVVTWGSGTPDTVRRSLERISQPYLVDEIRSLEALKQSFLRLGRVTTREDGAHRAADAVQEMIDSSATRLATATRNPATPTVFLQIWDQPLQSIGAGHILTEVIELCGARSISASAPGLAPTMSVERVIADDPDLIIVENEAQGRHWLRWPQLRAVRDQRIVVINPDLLHRPTLRLLQGMDAICREVGASDGR